MPTGATESAVRRQVKEMGDLVGAEEALAEVAYVLAKAVDSSGADPRALPNLTKELRLVLKQLSDGHAGGADDEWDEMGDPA